MGHQLERSRSQADGPITSDNVLQAMRIIELDLHDEALDAGKILALEQKSPVFVLSRSHSLEALRTQGFDHALFPAAQRQVPTKPVRHRAAHLIPFRRISARREIPEQVRDGLRSEHPERHAEQGCQDDGRSGGKLEDQGRDLQFRSSGATGRGSTSMPSSRSAWASARSASP